jgi:acyl carrier protein
MADKRQLITERLNHVFQDVFDDDGIRIHDDMTADDIEEWDSIMHITLVLEIEKVFNLKLNASEVGQLLNVGAMIDLLAARSAHE